MNEEAKIITWNIKSPDGLQSITIRTDDRDQAVDYASWALGRLPSDKAFPDDTGNMAHSEKVEAVPVCPVHKKQMTNGKWGWYCKTLVQENPKVWCKYKPQEAQA